MWPADLQLMGKDIIRVHATIWPAMLLSLELPLPKKFFVHGFFLSGGLKMSKSLGNVISPIEMADKYGSDAARYLLIDAAIFGSDGDVTWQKFDEKYTADLSNGLGNLVSRVLAMAEKYFNCVLDVSKTDKKFKFDFKLFDKNFEDLKLDENLKMIKDLVKQCDMYIAENKPWEAFKEDKDKVQKVLASAVLQIIVLAWLIRPFMPDTSDSILEQLNLKREFFDKKFKDASKGKVFFENTIKVNRGQALFPRLEKE